MSGHQPLTPSQMDQSYLVNVGRAKWISFSLLPQTPVSKMVCPLVTLLNLDHFCWADLSLFSKFEPRNIKMIIAVKLARLLNLQAVYPCRRLLLD